MPSLVTSADLQAAGTDDLKETGGALVDAAPDAQKKDVVAAAAEKLTSEQQLELAKEITGRWPKGDTARAAIYITGFLVAGAVLVGAGIIAWQAQSGENSIASDLIVAASSLVSLLIGGLVGAYVQR